MWVMVSIFRQDSVAEVVEEISSEDEYSLDKFEGDVASASYAEDSEYVVAFRLLLDTTFSGWASWHRRERTSKKS